jgi:hypothetical protein
LRYNAHPDRACATAPAATERAAAMASAAIPPYLGLLPAMSAEDPFDRLTQRLGRTTSRRQALGAFMGVLAAGLLGLGRVEEASAAHCRPAGKHCEAHGECCSAHCAASSHTCTCPAGETLCADHCVNIWSDHANCGRCGHHCPTGTQCSKGACKQAHSCPRGQSLCSGACVSITSDNQHCGSCGNKCPPGSTCNGGACQHQEQVCAKGLTSCAGTCCNGVCCSGPGAVTTCCTGTCCQGFCCQGFC